MRLFRNISVAAAIIALLFPAVTSAHFGSDVNGNVSAQVRADVNDGAHANQGIHLGQFMGMLTRGTVTAVNSTGFVIKTKSDNTVAVNTSGAKLIRFPRTTITLSDISVGDKVWVKGTRAGDTITATAVYDISANIKPAAEKGQVTAVGNNTLTLQTKHDNTVSVTTNSDTKVIKDGSPATLNDVTVGSKVKIFGFWNTITNLFTALMIKIK